MTTTPAPLGYAMTRALRAVAGRDPFDQAALHRLYSGDREGLLLTKAVLKILDNAHDEDTRAAAEDDPA